jgi:hypothetical protein
MEKGPSHLGPGQVKQSGSTLIFDPSYSASRRAEHFFETLTEFPGPDAFFWIRAAATFGDLFICAKDLFVEVMGKAAHRGQHSRPWLARLAAMPEVLSVQFMQTLCSNGVKLRLEFAVADKCNGKHEQHCANDPHSEPSMRRVRYLALHVYALSTCPSSCGSKPPAARMSSWIRRLKRATFVFKPHEASRPALT